MYHVTECRWSVFTARHELSILNVVQLGASLQVICLEATKKGFNNLASETPFITPACADMRIQTVVIHFPYDCTFKSVLHLAWITRHSLNSMLFTSLDSVPCPPDNRFLTLEITVCWAGRWGGGGVESGVTFHLLCSDLTAHCC